MNREKQLERALKRLVAYIQENHICDVIHSDYWGEQSGQWLTLLDDATDTLKKDTDG